MAKVICNDSPDSVAEAGAHRTIIQPPLTEPVIRQLGNTTPIVVITVADLIFAVKLGAGR